MGFFDGLGSAIGGIAGAFLDYGNSQSSAKSQAAANAWNQAFSREQFEYQKELARNQIQWKVEDAKKAGLHPMAALGLSSMSYSPVSGYAQGFDYNNGVGQSLVQMGQNIDRAIQTGRDREERRKAEALQDIQFALSTENQELQNDFLREQIYALRAKTALQMGPPAPSTRGLGKSYSVDGQSDSKLPAGTGYAQAGEPLYEVQTDLEGRLALLPGNDYSQKFEDKFPLDYVPFLDSFWQRQKYVTNGEPVLVRDKDTGDEFYIIYDADANGFVPYVKGKKYARPIQGKIYDWFKQYNFRRPTKFVDGRWQ